MGLQTCAKDVTGLDTSTMPSIGINTALVVSGQNDDNATDPAKASPIAETPPTFESMGRRLCRLPRVGRRSFLSLLHQAMSMNERSAS